MRREPASDLARSRVRAGAAALPVALLVVLAGCSGDDSPGAQRGPRVGRTTTTIAPSSTTSTLPRSAADVVAPRDAAETAATLARVERAIRTTNYDAARSPALGWVQQVAYGTLGAHPDWLDAVLAALPADLVRVVRATYDAAAPLSAPDLGHAPVSLPTTAAELPDWTIRSPLPPDVLLSHYHQGEREFGIPWQYLAAVHFLETKMGRIHGNSTAGARGPMQFLPDTWAAYGAGGDIDDDHDAILGAARYLAAAGGPSDMARALRAYNPSDAYVAAVTRYAQVIVEEPRAYYGFYAWQVFVATAQGDQLLPEGWTRPP